jgi:DNA-binding transcriptional LysR family regulator
MSTPAQLEALRDGSIDIGFLREPAKEDDLDIQFVHSENFLAVLPARHALAARSRVPLLSLAPEPFVLFPRSLGEIFHDQITSMCREAGFAPRVVQEATQWATIVALVEARLGVSIVPACVARRGGPGVVFRTLSPAARKTRIALCRLKGTASPVTARFVEIARAVME